MTAKLVIAMVVIPLVTALTGLVLRGAFAILVRQLAGVALFCCACVIAHQTLTAGEVVTIGLSGWQVPLGIRLYLDGLSAALLVVTGCIACCITFYTEWYFGERARRGRLSFFWPLWFLVWAALNGLFVSADAFNLYVTLEVINLAAVALVALSGQEQAVRAALRYLVIAFLGSLSYLFGVAILYSSLGVLDLQLLTERAVLDGPYILAAVLMLIGLMIKTALFPMHFWLPPAHASAPTPVSALLSGLVVTASAYILIRLSFTVYYPLLATPLAPLLGVLGGMAVVWGSLHALLQERVKLVIAYSTVAQLGYLFLALPMVMAQPDIAALVWYGLLYFMLCHASAKAAAFLAAGTMIRVLDHDQVALLAGTAQRWPMLVMAFGLAGINLIGLPPSGGFLGKWLLLQAAVANGQWLVLLILVAGSLLAAGYIFRVVGAALKSQEPSTPAVAAPWPLAVIALVLAVLPLLLGIFSHWPFRLLAVGSPFGSLS